MNLYFAMHWLMGKVNDFLLEFKLELVYQLPA